MTNLIMGLLWLAFGTFFLIENNFTGLTSYLFIAVAVFYFAIYIFELSHQYLTLEYGMLTRNLLVKDSIPLKEVKSIRKSGGFTLILKTENREMSINTRIIEPHSLELLEKELEKLNVERD